MIDGKDHIPSIKRADSGYSSQSSEIEYSVLGGVNFSLPETPGLSPVCGVESKEEGGTISFSPPTPFTPSVPVESSEIR